MNLKVYYDAVMAAETTVQTVLNQMDGLFTDGKKAEALELRPALDEAKSKAKEANDIYLMMRESVDSMGVAAKFIPASKTPEDKAQSITRAEFENLSPAARAEFIKGGGLIKDEE
jgi:FMN-dependent NADH-azoreductase